jgi:hypothetical protein
MTDMASQGQAVARQQNRWLEPFVIALAIAAIMITLAWGAFTALSAPSTVAPSKTTEQILQEPGLLEQRAGERAGASGGYVVRTAPGPKQALPKSAPGNPYVNIHVPVRKPATIMTDGLVEHDLGERGMVHRRGHPQERN